MMDDDSNLRRQFDALKAEDERAARPFSSYWDALRQSIGRNRWSLNVSAITTALALLLIAAVSGYVRSARHASSDQISYWRSPTASLLHTPGEQLYTDMPRIGEPPIPSFKEQRN